MKLSQFNDEQKRLTTIGDLRQRRTDIGGLIGQCDDGVDLVVGDGFDERVVEISGESANTLIREALAAEMRGVEAELTALGVEIDEAPGADDVELEYDASFEAASDSPPSSLPDAADDSEAA